MPLSNMDTIEDHKEMAINQAVMTLERLAPELLIENTTGVIEALTALRDALKETRVSMEKANVLLKEVIRYV